MLIPNVHLSGGCDHPRSKDRDTSVEAPIPGCLSGPLPAGGFQNSTDFGFQA